VGENESGQAVRHLRVMLVDDHEVVRKGLRSLIESAADLEVVAEAASVAEAIRQAHESQPDVVVMDVRLPDGSGIEAARDIRAGRQATRVLMLTSYADELAVFASIMAGASGYLLKDVNGAELLAGIRAVGIGRSLLDPAVTGAVLERIRTGNRPLRDPKLSRLSAQEERILNLVAQGKTNAEIGNEITLSDKTVKNYVSAILGKLEVRRRAEAAAYLASHTPREPGSI
jgi:two-component system, NarL family, response regulator DevR